ncbi:MAG: hypothetical protein J6I85_09200 [Clostridia bacterium]|nr:hypothetical protein [Clostridia bacterium]
MPGYVIHVAIAQEYLKKHSKNEDKTKFIEGNIYPDLIKPKSQSHYGKSPAYTSLEGFLNNNTIDNSLDRGKFLHLIADYLFYNHYLDYLDKEELHNDYDILNDDIIKKYDVKLPDIVKQYAFSKSGIPKIINLELVYKVIDEVSSLDMDIVAEEVKNGMEKWKTYKNLI